MKDFQSQYVRLLTNIFLRGTTDHNRRTNHDMTFLPEGALLTADLSDARLPVPGIRKVFPRTAAVEVAWFLQGLQHVDFVSQYTPMWDKFVEDDGHTVHAAYGYRWRRHFGRDQVELAVRAISEDPSDRQVLVMAWDPSSDALGSPKFKNVPCPVLFQLFAHENTKEKGLTTSSLVLGMSVYKRSTDVFVGLPYDVIGHSLLLFAIVAELQEREKEQKRKNTFWKPGTLQFHLAHPHLYRAHEEDASKALSQYLDNDKKYAGPRAPMMWSTTMIAETPDVYINHVSKIQKSMAQPEFAAKPEVIA